MNADGSRRLDQLLQRLVQLAGDAHDELATGDWDGAAPLLEAFDESFATLEALVRAGHAFAPEHRELLGRLGSIHADNTRLAADLRRTASAELEQVGRARQVNSAYSPLGANHRPSPRYVDGAA